MHRVLHNWRPHSQPWIRQPASLTVSLPCNLLAEVPAKWKSRPHAHSTEKVCGLIWLSKFMRRICEFEYRCLFVSVSVSVRCVAVVYSLSWLECKQNKVAHLWRRWLARRTYRTWRTEEDSQSPENVCAPPRSLIEQKPCSDCRWRRWSRGERAKVTINRFDLCGKHILEELRAKQTNLEPTNGWLIGRAHWGYHSR